MGHHIRGVVAKIDLLHDHGPKIVPESFVAPLRGDVGFLATFVEDADDDGLDWNEIARWLSVFGPVVAVETEYFGGAGGQAAGLWRDGVEEIKAEWSEGSPISRALKALGVAQGEYFDEFEAAGLGWYRSNEDWKSFALTGKSKLEHQIAAKNKDNLGA